MNKHRIEALSDGVFAIAMTLLVLDIKVPAETPPAELTAALLKEFHSWISFSVTFLIASVFWVLQHRLLDLMESVSMGVAIPTFVFLGFVSVLPFSTSLWGHHPSQAIAMTVYFGNQLLIAVALTVQLEYARINGHLRPGPASELMRFRLLGISCVMLIACIAVRFLPVEWIWPVPLAMGIVARIARRAKERKLRGQEAAVSGK